EQIAVLDRMFREYQGDVGFYHQPHSPERVVAKMLRLREEVIPRFLDELMEEVDFGRYCLVGFGCLFDQTFASLALARRIKRAYRGPLTAFGGCAWQGPVGPALQGCFAEMDVVAYGDGEPVIGPLVEAARGLRPLAEVPNITYRTPDGQVLDSAATAKINLD